jgi:hypothetical protein
MANTTVKLKRSGESGNVPVSLAYGELALNYADGKLFYKASNGSILQFSAGTSTPSDSFATINANSSLILATSPTDTLSILPGNNITISADVFNKSIVINSTAAGGGNSIDQYARDTANSALPQSGGTVTGNLTVDGTVRVSNTYNLPTYDGIYGQALVTNGAGTVTWESISGGGGGFPFVDLGLISDPFTTMVDMGTLA